MIVKDEDYAVPIRPTTKRIASGGKSGTIKQGLFTR